MSLTLHLPRPLGPDSVADVSLALKLTPKPLPGQALPPSRDQRDQARKKQNPTAEKTAHNVRQPHVQGEEDAIAAIFKHLAISVRRNPVMKTR